MGFNSGFKGLKSITKYRHDNKDISLVFLGSTMKSEQVCDLF